MKQYRQLPFRFEDPQKVEYKCIEDFIRERIPLVDENADHKAVGASVGHFAQEEEGGGRV